MGGHHDAHHDDHHGHHEDKYVSYAGEKVHVTAPPVPPMGSQAFDEAVPVFNEEKLLNNSRTNADRLKAMLTLQAKNSTNESPALGFQKASMGANSTSYFDRFFHILSYPIPRTYTSTYMRPNPCPEVHWWNSWRWPKFRQTNPKVDPPVDGAFNDYYHYLAFKNWFDNERSVYYQTVSLHHEMVMRCLAKEGKYNGWKNCKHLFNKSFALTREAEHNQVVLHMAVTGQNAIRETPYPEDHVEQKRKIYDNWLFRTRMRKPGDIM